MKRWRLKRAECVIALSCGDTRSIISAHRTGKSGAPKETSMKILPNHPWRFGNGKRPKHIGYR